MSLRYKIMRARVREYTTAQAATIAALIGGAIVALGLLLGAATMHREASGATLTPVSGQCWTGGCGRAVV